MRAVKPTIDAGGRMVLLSRSDKSKPLSPFKRIYTAARKGETDWSPVFLPWSARPDRTPAWYEVQKKDILHRTGSLDDLAEQYPSSDAEAPSPRTMDKRISPDWLLQCYRERRPLGVLADSPPIPGLDVFNLPRFGRRYVIGADPAEGNPTSDDSALTVMDDETGEEVAALAGKYQPAVFAAHIDAIGSWFNGASVLIERNNHGHAVIGWMRDFSRLSVLCGTDGREGWLTNSKGKTLLYDAAADAFREQATVLHSFATFTQLASIEGSTQRAPQGEHDDRADSYALACMARRTHAPSCFIEGPLICYPFAPGEDGGQPSDVAAVADRSGRLVPPAAPPSTTPGADHLRELVQRYTDDLDETAPNWWDAT